ncbi:MAG TPA: hypothetical protein VNJ03_13465 [Vicinamibacterales bacterium]|nr:hypothetical protein [Vicinamibacterales bacterium]
MRQRAGPADGGLLFSATFHMLDAGSELVVPGSISHLGPGFDALSVAVRLYLRVRVLEMYPGSPATAVS